MKSSSQLLVATFVVMGFLGSNAYRSHLAFMSSADNNKHLDKESALSGTAAESALANMVTNMMSETGPSIQEVTEAAMSHMDMREASRRVDGKLPAEVALLVRTSSKRGHRSYVEASIQKARRILNTMIEEAWKELDTILIACKEYYLRNRKTYLQVVRDLNRLGAQMSVADAERIKASEGIAQSDRMTAEIAETLRNQKTMYQKERLVDQTELAVRSGDVAVFAFILSLVRCNATTSLLQQTSNSATSFRVCRGADSSLELNINNAGQQAKFNRMMTPSARRAFHTLLGQMESQASFLQLGEKTKQAPNVTSDTTAVTFAAVAEPVIDSTIPSVQWKKCADGTPDCGKLHDLMAMMWGKFKDLTDELEASMKKKDDAWQELSADLNAQLASSSEEKAAHMEALAEATSSINADSSERSEKDNERRELGHAFNSKMKECHEKSSEILFTHICAIRKVRNSVLRHSTDSPLKNVSDCAVSEWVSGECSMECDNACPNPLNPYACGGWQRLQRTVVSSPNAFGYKCPALVARKKCNQMKCPVDCVMSAWSGWSTCTKDCEGGVQTKTRSIMVAAKNGGKECDNAAIEQPCHTGSCDRDCQLQTDEEGRSTWTDWSPCSVACGGGLSTRKRDVIIPIRGQGRCPTAASRYRFGERQCNVQECAGDEICVAKQDLIMLIDSSGSMSADGFTTLRTFAANLTDRYKPEFFGSSEMRVGVALFGNGAVESDGSISKAVQVQDLTADMAGTKTLIAGTAWQKGFTNLAQGLVLADKMLTNDGRQDAQSAVMVLTDGKMNFLFQTREQAEKLKAKNIMLYMALVSEFQGDEAVVLKKLASQPWETNYVRIPGMEALSQNEALFAGQLVAKFCPDSISPSQMAAKDEQRNYMLIHEGGFPSNNCGRWYWIGRVANQDACADGAREKSQQAFSFGTSRYNTHYCYSEAIPVTIAKWNRWLVNRTGPACEGGSWINNPYYDVYAIKPAASV